MVEVVSSSSRVMIDGCEYQVIGTSGGGSCFFDCVAYCVSLGPWYARREASWGVRQRVVDFVIYHWERFGGLSYDNVGMVLTEVEAYEAYMRSVTSYACHVEVQAAAELYGLTVVVHNVEGRVLHVLNRDGRKVLPVTLTGEGGHYEYLDFVRASHAAVVRGTPHYRVPSTSDKSPGFWDVGSCGYLPVAVPTLTPAATVIGSGVAERTILEPVVMDTSRDRDWTTVRRRGKQVALPKALRKEELPQQARRRQTRDRPSRTPANAEAVRNGFAVLAEEECRERERRAEKLGQKRQKVRARLFLTPQGRKATLPVEGNVKTCVPVIVGDKPRRALRSRVSLIPHKCGRSCRVGGKRCAMTAGRPNTNGARRGGNRKFGGQVCCGPGRRTCVHCGAEGECTFGLRRLCRYCCVTAGRGCRKCVGLVRQSGKVLVRSDDVRECSVRLPRVLPCVEPVAKVGDGRTERSEMGADAIVRTRTSACTDNAALRESVPVERPRPCRVPPTKHNGSGTFTRWNMKRPHSQKSQFYKFAYTYDGDVLEEHVEPLSIGALDECTCSHCGAYYFFVERAKDGGYRECCHRGKVVVPALQRPTGPVLELYTGGSQAAVQFRKNLRVYNNLFSMGNTVGKWDTGEGRGPYVLQIDGQIKHLMNCNDPASKRNSTQRDQIYFVNSINESVEARLKRAKIFSWSTDKDILRLLEAYIRAHNPYAQSYGMLKDYLATVEKNSDIVHVILAINPLPAGEWHRRGVPFSARCFGNRLETPRQNSVAAVFVGDFPPVSYDVRVILRRDDVGGKFVPVHLQDRVLENCQSVDPLCYTLLHLHGEPAWSGSTSLLEGGGFATKKQYYSYRLMVRAGEYNPLFLAEKLTLQYLCDAALKIEYDNISWIVKNRQESLLLCETADVLRAHMRSEAARLGKPVGRLVCLPSDFPGSPRFMVKQYLDVMAIMTKYGVPTFFVTFTMNPGWEEITSALKVGDFGSVEQCSHYRPDLIMRVFQGKFKAFFADILYHQAFGKVVAWAYVLEFQKRGLPHVHLALMMDQADRVQDQSHIDCVVSAELPDPVTYPILSERVRRWQVHTPCSNLLNDGNMPHCYRPVPGGAANETRCRFRFPKEFRETTEMPPKGEIRYRRRDQGITYIAGGVVIDNRWVSPYNAAMLLRYDTHINVQVCNTNMVARYMFKYMHKGEVQPNISPETYSARQAEITGVYDWDEAEHFKTTRVLTPFEAAGKILQIPFWQKSCSVTVLPVHGPGEETVYFEEGGAGETSELCKESKLVAFFNLCAADRTIRLYYSDVPSKYKWETKNHAWRAKSHETDAVGRLAQASPLESNERFYIRLLLLNVPSPVSFTDLRTVRGEIQETFHLACIALGILVDDQAYHRILADMGEVMSAFQFRKLFGRMIAFFQVATPLALWEEFKGTLAADFAHLLSLPDNTMRVSAEELALASIDKVLQDCGTSARAEGLVLAGDSDDSADIRNRLLSDNFGDVDEYRVPPAAEVAEAVSELNGEQKALYDAVIAAVEGGNAFRGGRLFFVDGPGGSGKTHVYNVIANALLVGGRKVLCCAYTGLAASLLVKGRTCHNVFGIPTTDLDHSSRSTLSLQSRNVDALRECHVILWDEISMTSDLQLSVADNLLRVVTGHADLDMGGKVVVFGGDFRQGVPDPVRFGGRAYLVKNTVQRQAMWARVNKVALTENMRARSDTDAFCDWLLRVGAGCPTTLGTGGGVVTPTVEIDPDMVIERLEDLEMFVFGDYSSLSGRAILTLTNSTSERVNESCLDKLFGEERTYLATTSCGDNNVVSKGYMRPDQALLNKLTHRVLPPHTLRLRVGCRVMLLTNIGVGSGLCNGTLMEVLQYYEHAIRVRILNGVRSGQEEYLFRVKLIAKHERHSVTIVRYQFPIRLAFSMTINKSQGQSFDRVGVYLDRDPFLHGQLYVALSRAKTRRNLKVCVANPPPISGGRRGRPKLVIRNVVYQEVLYPEEFVRVEARPCNQRPY